MNYRVHYACVCDVGKRRSINQDNYVCEHAYRVNMKVNDSVIGDFHAADHIMLGVFDGMGGEEYGEVASVLAARTFAECMRPNAPFEALSGLCYDANTRICQFADEKGAFSMGTTAAVLLFTETGVVLCNIGDSKIHKVSRYSMEQISQDHITQGTVGRKPPLSQCLGIPPEEFMIMPYIVPVPVEDGDCFVISSDGLTDLIPCGRIEEVVRTMTAEDGTRVLLQEALEMGGHDNITIIICKVTMEKNLNTTTKDFFRKIFSS